MLSILASDVGNVVHVIESREDVHGYSIRPKGRRVLARQSNSYNMAIDRMVSRVLWRGHHL